MKVAGLNEWSHSLGAGTLYHTPLLVAATFVSMQFLSGDRVIPSQDWLACKVLPPPSRRRRRRGASVASYAPRYSLGYRSFATEWNRGRSEAVAGPNNFLHLVRSSGDKSTQSGKLRKKRELSSCSSLWSEPGCLRMRCFLSSFTWEMFKVIFRFRVEKVFYNLCAVPRMLYS